MLTKFYLMEGRRVAEETHHPGYTAARGGEGEEIQRQNLRERLGLRLVTGINLSPVSFSRCKLLPSLSNLPVSQAINGDRAACLLNDSLRSLRIDTVKLRSAENNT